MRRDREKKYVKFEIWVETLNPTPSLVDYLPVEIAGYRSYKAVPKLMALESQRPPLESRPLQSSSKNTDKDCLLCGFVHRSVPFEFHRIGHASHNLVVCAIL